MGGAVPYSAVPVLASVTRAGLSTDSTGTWYDIHPLGSRLYDTGILVLLEPAVGDVNLVPDRCSCGDSQPIDQILRTVRYGK